MLIDYEVGRGTLREAMRLLEPALAARAAERATADLVDELAQTVRTMREELSDLRVFLVENERFNEYEAELRPDRPRSTAIYWVSRATPAFVAP
jgi:DNA-binding GntR family transcriptional regulator